MSTVKKVLLAVFSLYILVLLAGYFLPEQSVVSRSIVINAPKERVFELVSTHKNFQLWSPWAKKDPKMTITFEGPEKGVNSKSIWQSNHPQVGDGESIYTVYEPYRKAVLSLKFEQGGGDAVFLLNSLDAAQTKVEWQFVQNNINVFARYFGYFLLEKILAPDYEQGLSDLKAIAELSTSQ